MMRSNNEQIKITIIFCVFFVSLQIVDVKVFTRCDLARELIRQNFSRTFLSNWICLIESESGRDTRKITNSSILYPLYGLFQISSKRYCNKVVKGGLCSLKCDSLIDDKIDDDSMCAKLIFETDGFKVWKGWMNECKQKPLPDLTKCTII